MGLGRANLHYLLDAPPACDPNADSFMVEITNADGTIFSWTLPPGSFVQKDPLTWLYRDVAAKQSGGPAFVKVTNRVNVPLGFRVDVRGFDDMSLATLPEMTSTVAMCGYGATTTDDWNPFPRDAGWAVNLAPAP